LAARPEPGAAAALATLRTMSPTAVMVTFAAIRRAAELPTITDVLAQDLKVSMAFTRHPDLVEGIRAAVIDKDRNPRWEAARWEDVPEADVESYFG
jgi:enoyl-CoA hydratase